MTDKHEKVLILTDSVRKIKTTLRYYYYLPDLTKINNIDIR